MQALEGHRAETIPNNKLDTSLEQALQENLANENTSYTCSISLDPVNSDRGGCQHKKKVFQDNYNTCFKCGSFVPQVTLYFNTKLIRNFRMELRYTRMKKLITLPFSLLRQYMKH